MAGSKRIRSSEHITPLQLMTMYHSNKSGYGRFSSSEDIIHIIYKQPRFQTLAVTMTLKTASHYFHWTLSFMVVYLKAVFGWAKKNNSSENILLLQASYLYYTNPHCDLDLEDSNPMFTQDTPTHNHVPPLQVWLQKLQQFRAQTNRQMDPRWFHGDQNSCLTIPKQNEKTEQTIKPRSTLKLQHQE